MFHSENCGVSDAGVQELIKIHQLQDLRLGSAGDEPASKVKNTFTKEGFEAVLKALEELPTLTTLEMRLPSLKKISIGKISGNSGFMNIGERGAQFVANNLKNLTELYICTQ